MTDIHTKAERCRALHAGARPVVSGGCWNAGTARLLAHVGFPLLETSSAGAMFARGLPDAAGLASRDFMLDTARAIAAAVAVPVLADLENGFGDPPETVADTIRRAGATGIVGGSIEDATARPDDPIYPLAAAQARIRAAAEAARALPFRFMLTARADQYLWGRPDLAEVVRRARAFQEAGADAVLAPGLTDPAGLKTLCAAVDIPVVALIGSGQGRPDLDHLAATGVRRIGAAGGLAGVALTAFMNAARDLVEGRGADAFAAALPTRTFNDLFGRLGHGGDARE
jgi:2-methylisocitrate lyase-like PEP mutase family enzyme